MRESKERAQKQLLIARIAAERRRQKGDPRQTFVIFDSSDSNDDESYDRVARTTELETNSRDPSEPTSLVAKREKTTKQRTDHKDTRAEIQDTMSGMGIEQELSEMGGRRKNHVNARRDMDGTNVVKPKGISEERRYSLGASPWATQAKARRPIRQEEGDEDDVAGMLENLALEQKTTSFVHKAYWHDRQHSSSSRDSLLKGLGMNNDSSREPQGNKGLGNQKGVRSLIASSRSNEAENVHRRRSEGAAELEEHKPRHGHRESSLQTHGIQQGLPSSSSKIGSDELFGLDASLAARLYRHQLEGVEWMHGLFKVGSGGILADDMGLGKTLQVSAYLSGLLRQKLIRRACIVAPKTLLAAWKKELNVCGLMHASKEYYGSPGERKRALQSVVSAPGVLLTTYGMVLHNADELSSHEDHDEDDGPLWDVLIMDEGHKLKNPKTQLRSRIELLPIKQRILITGTPIQNNLMEMHALVDLVCPDLLGDPSAFKMRYERVITAGSDKHATLGERQRAASRATELRNMLRPFMLRREKGVIFVEGNNPETKSTAVEKEGVDEQQDSVLDGCVPRGLSTMPNHDTSQQGTQISRTDVSDSRSGDECSSSALKEQSCGSAPSMSFSARKNDIVVWLRLKAHQRTIYEAFLNSKSVREALNRTSSPLAALTVLKKICDHPALLSEKAQEGIKMAAKKVMRKGRKKPMRHQRRDLQLSDTSDSESSSTDGDACSVDGADAGEDDVDDEKIHGHIDLFSTEANSKISTSIFQKLHSPELDASCKTTFVLTLLDTLVKEGHKTLVFSQSKKMLDILEAGVRAKDWRMCRIDGSVSSIDERQRRVDAFQNDQTIPIFLLTSQVGGLGLTLTAADRVIIVDPAWNPSVDSQSVDRAYRIGQQKDVVVYRLISCGTVEDKIYRKQVFKGGLFRTSTEVGEQFRYFSAADLRDLFRLDPIEAVVSSTQRQLSLLHAHQRRTTPDLEEHLTFLQSIEGVSGVSDHDLLYTVKESNQVSTSDTNIRDGSVFGFSEDKMQGIRLSKHTLTSPNKRNTRLGRESSSNCSSDTGWGWHKKSDLSNMFSKTLMIVGDGEALPRQQSMNRRAAVTNPISAAMHGRDSVSTTSKRRDTIAKLQDQLFSQRKLLKNGLLISGLADKGEKIRARIEELKSRIQMEQDALWGDSGLLKATDDSHGVSYSEEKPVVPDSSEAVCLVEESMDMRSTLSHQCEGSVDRLDTGAMSSIRDSIHLERAGSMSHSRTGCSPPQGPGAWDSGGRRSSRHIKRILYQKAIQLQEMEEKKSAGSSSTADDEVRRLRSEVERLAILWESGGEVA